MSESRGVRGDPNLMLWELRQLVKCGSFPDEQAALRSALHALFQTHPRMKINMLTVAYEAGEISLGRAATMLGVSQEEMKDILREAGSEIHLGPQTIEELRQDVCHA